MVKASLLSCKLAGRTLEVEPRGLVSERGGDVAITQRLEDKCAVRFGVSG